MYQREHQLTPPASLLRRELFVADVYGGQGDLMLCGHL